MNRQSEPGYESFERLVGLAIVFLLVVACFVIVAPFVPALIWSTFIVISLWGPLERVAQWLGGRRKLVGVLLGLAIAALLIVPGVRVVDTLVGSGPSLQQAFDQIIAGNLANPPLWLADLPLIGAHIATIWRGVFAGTVPIAAELKTVVPAVLGWLAAGGLAIGSAALQFLLVAIACGVLYAHGEASAALANRFAERIGGRNGLEALDIAARVIRAVSLGVVGTAFVQAVLAAIGFWVAGVPAAALLGAIALVLCIAQIGPLLVWVPACIWLYSTGNEFAAIGLAVWSALVVQGIDNVLRPLLISRSARLPLLVMLIGVLGGLLAVGLIGVFIGPTLLAVGHALLLSWLSPDETERA